MSSNTVPVTLTCLTIDEELVKSLVEPCGDIQRSDIVTNLSHFTWYDLSSGVLGGEQSLSDNLVPYELDVDGCGEWSAFSNKGKILDSGTFVSNNFVMETIGSVPISDVKQHITDGDLIEFLKEKEEEAAFDWIEQEYRRERILEKQ